MCEMQIHCFLQRPVPPRLKASVRVLTQHRVLAPPPLPIRLLNRPEKVCGVAESAELEHLLLYLLVNNVPVRVDDSHLSQLQKETVRIILSTVRRRQSTVK